MPPMIELKKICQRFQLESGASLEVLRDINLKLDEGEVIALLGPSGSGKSTCLRIMAGLVHPTSGQILVEGKPLEGVNQHTSLVFQSFALFPWLTVQENITMALKPMTLTAIETKRRVKQAIDWVGLEGFEEAYPREMSGGMKQRVGIARALVMERPVLFLDEPCSALDVLTADMLRSEIVDLFLNKETPTRSIVLVTHSIQEAVMMAGRILIMGVNPGHIKHEIRNELPYPRDENTPAFAHMASLIHASITETLLPDSPPSVTKNTDQNIPQTEPIYQVLPHVSFNEVIGLLENLEAQGGCADLFKVSAQIAKDFGRTLFLVKAAELLSFVDTPKSLVQLTPVGQALARADINQRKHILHEQFATLTLVQAISQELKIWPNQRAPIQRIETLLQQWLPNENAKSVAKTLIGWGRFAEYFGYNDNSKELYRDTGQEI